MIFSFSATGNSLHLAKAVAERTGDEVREVWRMPEAVTDVSSEPSVGFVFPVWYYDMPDRLKEIIRTGFRFGQDQMVWAVMDYGTFPGSACARTVKFFSSVGVDLRFALSYRMPENYIMMFDSPSDREVEEQLSKVQDYACEVAEEIALQDVLRPRFSAVGSLASCVLHPFYGVLRRTRRFRSTDDCNGCGTCRDICPARVISIESGRPVWTAPRCLDCAACINRCPEHAIEYGGDSHSRKRYINPFSGY